MPIRTLSEVSSEDNPKPKLDPRPRTASTHWAAIAPVAFLLVLVVHNSVARWQLSLFHDAGLSDDLLGGATQLGFDRGSRLKHHQFYGRN